MTRSTALPTDDPPAAAGPALKGLSAPCGHAGPGREQPPTDHDRPWRTSGHHVWWGLVLGASWGMLAGWWFPRGPLTTAQAVASIVIGLAVGAAAGVLSRSRWTTLLAPAGFAAVFELVRWALEGPTVDGVQLSTYGIIAFVVGRGFSATVVLLPLVVGAAFGAGAVRRRGGVPVGELGRARRVLAGLGALVLVALTAALVMPARTEPISGGVAELTTVEVDGHDLALMVRGRSTQAPVLLFLAGGPGGSELGAMRRHLPDLERHFVVATLDQRGTGKSYPELDPTDTVTVDRAVADVLDVTSYLRDRFDRDRILLVGQSWGSTLGVLAVQRNPEAFSGFVGVGQMVSPLATDRHFYEDTLAWARSRGDAELAGELERIGPPPYGRMLDYETALSHEHEVYPYDHAGNSEGQGGFSENFLVEEYTLLEKVHLLGAFMDTFAALYPQLQDVDFRESATSFDVPVFFVQGAHEARGRADLFEAWYPMVQAPVKDRVTFEGSGHRPLFEQPDQFVAYLAGTVLPHAR